jgi:hypothetical protein
MTISLFLSKKKKASSNNNSIANFNNVKTNKKDDRRKASSENLLTEVTDSSKSSSQKEGKEGNKVMVPDPDLDEHPLKNGNSLVVKYRDGSHRLAKIIEKMTKNVDKNVGNMDKTGEKIGEKKVIFQYYVHYNDFNRRMDEWISQDRIVLLPSGANVLAAEFAATHSHAPATDDKKVLPAGILRFRGSV